MDGVGVITANKVIHQSRFESQHWIFLRTSGTKLGVDLGTFPSRLGCNRDSYLLLKFKPSPSVFVATVTGF